VQKSKKAHNSKRNNKAVSENKSLHRFFYPNKQSKTRKERSDFATQQTIPYNQMLSLPLLAYIRTTHTYLQRPQLNITAA
jgi:hypothetical protein